MKRQNEEPSFAQVLHFRVFRDISEEPHPARLRIFNNGLQQCPIKVEIVVADANGNPVPYPTDPLKAPVLIDYDSEEQLLPSPVPNVGPPFWWQYSETKSEYLWDESIVPATTYPSSYEHPAPTSRVVPDPSPDMRQQTASYTFYVSTKLVGTKRIAASVRIPGTGIDVKTNSIVDDPDNGMFNSSVIVTATPFPSLPIENYGVFADDGSLLPHAVGNNDHFFFAREHYVHVSINGQHLELRRIYGDVDDLYEPPSYIWSIRSSRADPARWAMCYHSRPDWKGASVPTIYVSLNPWERRRSTNYLSHLMYRDCVGTDLPGWSSERIVIGLLMGNIRAVLMDSTLLPVPDIERMNFYILDAHGNTHALAIAFGAKLNQLRLMKA